MIETGFGGERISIWMDSFDEKRKSKKNDTVISKLPNGSAIMRIKSQPSEVNSQSGAACP